MSQRPSHECAQSTHLVSRIRAQHIQWWRNELRLDRHRVRALLLSCAQRLLDSVNAGGGVARQLDIRTELDGLGCQSSCDRADEDVNGCLGDGFGEVREDNLRFSGRSGFGGGVSD